MSHGRKLLQHVALHAVVQIEEGSYYMEASNILLAIAVTASFASAYLIGMMLSDVKDKLRKVKSDEDGSVWIRGLRYVPEEDSNGSEQNTIP